MDNLTETDLVCFNRYAYLRYAKIGVNVLKYIGYYPRIYREEQKEYGCKKFYEMLDDMTSVSLCDEYTILTYYDSPAFVKFGSEINYYFESDEESLIRNE